MRALFLIPIILLASCDEPEPTEAERKARVEAIERANEGVVFKAEPEPILYPDIESNELYGASCAFAPEGRGMAPILLAMDDFAYMKLRGEIARFAPDKGTQKGPSIAWTKYDGRQYSLNFGLGAELGEGSTGGTTAYEARLTLREGNDRIVYDASGEAQCSS